MVSISIIRENIVFSIEGWDRLWSFKSSLEIPVDHVIDARFDPEPAMGWFQGMKLLGTDIPHFFRAGTFYQEGGLIFWDVFHPDKTIVIELEHERYKKLIIEVEDPFLAIELIKKTIQK